MSDFVGLFPPKIFTHFIPGYLAGRYLVLPLLNNLSGKFRIWAFVAVISVIIFIMCQVAAQIIFQNLQPISISLSMADLTHSVAFLECQGIVERVNMFVRKDLTLEDEGAHEGEDSELFLLLNGTPLIPSLDMNTFPHDTNVELKLPENGIQVWRSDVLSLQYNGPRQDIDFFVNVRIRPNSVDASARAEIMMIPDDILFSSSAVQG